MYRDLSERRSRFRTSKGTAQNSPFIQPRSRGLPKGRIATSFTAWLKMAELTKGVLTSLPLCGLSQFHLSPLERADNLKRTTTTP